MALRREIEEYSTQYRSFVYLMPLPENPEAALFIIISIREAPFTAFQEVAFALGAKKKGIL